MTQAPVRLIAHRGGVVDARRPENSASALEEAVRRGYWMVETDVDRSRDGRLVVHHGSFLRSFGDWRGPGALSWDRIRRLSAREDGSRPLEFAEYAALCRDRVRLMIDTKGSGHPDSFYESMERTLRENHLLESAWFIGSGEARNRFKGKARISAGAAALENALQAGEDASRLYFLFAHGRDLEAQVVERANRAGVPVVASINRYHYYFLLGSRGKAARADVLRLRALGVTHFQIDSLYGAWFGQGCCNSDPDS